MCLVAFAYQTDPLYDLVLIANRDEFFNRPTAPAQFWSPKNDVLAGKDLQGGGTWMGVTRDGRFALITNFRDPARNRQSAPSRGLLVSDFLTGALTAREYLERLAPRAGEYNGFNLIVGSLRSKMKASAMTNDLFYFSSIEGKVQEITPGLYGLSNHLFETPWPKVVRARSGLRQALFRHHSEKTSVTELKRDLFEILADPTPAPDHELPDTGVGLERERGLSSIFITMPGYGTRSSTVLLFRKDGFVEFSERSFSIDRKVEPQTVDFAWSLS